MIRHARLVAALHAVSSFALFMAAVDPARAQIPCEPIVLSGGASGFASASALDLPLSLRMGPAPVRAVLDRVSELTALRLSYSGDGLDLDRVVCTDLQQVPLSEALHALLGGRANAVLAASEHIVLAPAASDAVEAEADETEIIPLPPVFVLGAPSALSDREVPYSRTIVSGRDLVTSGTRDLAKAIGSRSAGLWAWTPSPLDPSLRYGSVRGASSFGSTHPKVYVDGIELANPLLLSRITPEAVDRIEVIRGPQGAALYGSEAISGVINIVTRQHALDAGAPRLSLRSGMGRVSSDFVAGGALSHDHVLTLEGGARERSARLSLSAGSTGAYLPGAGSRFFGLDGSARLVGSTTVVTTTARLSSDRATTGVLPLFEATGSGRPPRPRDRGSLHYTLGTRVSVSPRSAITHGLVVGVDGYARSGIDSRFAPALDSPLAPVADGAFRASVRASSNVRLLDRGDFAAALDLGAEQSLLREEVHFRDVDLLGSGPTLVSTSWQKSSGLLGLLEASAFDRVHLTAGLRLEANDGFSAGGGFETLPMVGVATTWDGSGLSLKVRSAFGSGIRPAGSAVRGAVGGRFPQPNLLSLAPERQTGLEGGLDLSHSSGLSVSLTRFRQVASGLIQEAAAPLSVELDAERAAVRRLQNVGEVGNDGWEAEAGFASGPLHLTAAFTAIDSRIRSLATGYSGDLRTGDRMLDVPSRTAALSASWAGAGVRGAVTLSRAWTWIGYDRKRMLNDSMYAAGADLARGDRLREYWRRYDGTPDLGASLDFDLPRGLTLLLRAENLFDRQVGEPDNLTILPGRSLSIGFRASY